MKHLVNSMTLEVPQSYRYTGKASGSEERRNLNQAESEDEFAGQRQGNGEGGDYSR